MKKYGIIGAMEEEVEMLKGEMKNVKISEIASMTFCEGQLWNHSVVVVRSGIGKVNMAVCTQILIDVFHVEALINTGVAGGLYSKLSIGDIVLSSDAIEHDLDVTGLGYKKGEIPRMDTYIFKADESLIKVAKDACETVNTDIQCFVGRVVTGDQFIQSSTKRQQLIEEFDGYCAEMEGAAMAQVAYLNHIPFLIIRAISDKADDSAQMSYEQFEKQAIIHTMKLLAAMFLKMKE